MRKSSIFILLLIGALLVLSPTKSSKDDSDLGFNGWRPNTIGSGCHSAGTRNDQVSGSIVFETSWLVVEKDEEFVLSISIANFGGKVAAGSDNDVTIGFNILDEQNSNFMSTTTINASHGIDGSGNSDIPWTPTFTAPTATGNYTLVAYAIASDTDAADPYFEWIRGLIRIEVKEPSGPQGVGFLLTSGGIVNDKITLTINIFNLSDAKTIELKIDEGSFLPITLDNFQFHVIDVTGFSPGIHIVTIKITNQADLITMNDLEFEIPEPINTTSVTTTISTDPVTQPTETKKEDHGVLSNPVILAVLVVIMLVTTLAPLILMKTFFNK